MANKIPPWLTVIAVGDCGLCEKCASACTFGALQVGQNGPVFAETCNGCGLCALACPRKNIKVRPRPGDGKG